MRYGSRIRRRIRGKLGSSMRRLFDSLEILSTLGRRLDLYVMSGRLQATNESQLWSLLFKMADNALIDKARLFNRLRTAESEDGEFAQQLVVRLRQADGEPSTSIEVEIDNCLRSISDAMDRRILSLWLTGEPHTSIAHLVDLPATAVRKRWEKIKQELKGRFETAGAR
jgi:DNA-directed RNA polymerase specialized sigma24 family protein